ncbi:c-type cytochrome [Alcaligenaceae bacterium CGII-47]|nr:c-type cytochrome [Alcaligenaceae bacterium CGII-47]
MALRFYFCGPWVSGFLFSGALFLGCPAWADSPTEQGEKIALSGSGAALACVTCHGEKGEGMAAAGFPHLAGQGAGYLALQLQGFAQGERSNPIMEPIAKALNAKQIRAVSAYYSQLPAPFDIKALSAHLDTYPTKGSMGAWLANRGDWGNNIPACIQCHGPGGVGVGESFPAIVGLPPKYTREQLLAWKEKKRAAGPLTLMGDIAGRLSDTQITAVADYFASLPVSAQNHSAQVASSNATVRSKTAATASAPDFTPPDADAIPDDEFGKVVQRGQDIFLKTGTYAGQFVGNTMNCVNCHIDAGRRANASPLWAAYVLYPAYRTKNNHVNTLAERIQGCFQYSMNGAKPPADSDTIVALESYMYWLAQGAPTGVKLEGQGYKRLSEPTQKADYIRGQQVFQQECALCHGADGAGQSVSGNMVFPALWGDQSYNWGAGMHSIATAAAFIKANMPLGNGNTLSDQQAWDVAYYMNAQERPQDPRFNGSVEETQKKFHNAKTDLYGQIINGKVLGAQSTPAGGAIRVNGLNSEPSKD